MPIWVWPSPATASAVLRPDLRLFGHVIRQFDGARVAKPARRRPGDREPGPRLAGRAPVYLGRDPRLGIEDQTVRAVTRALAEEEGGILVFLPGQGEILRTAERLAERLKRPHDRDCPALWRAGCRRPGSRYRANAGWPPQGRAGHLHRRHQLDRRGRRRGDRLRPGRVPRYDPASGLTRLVTVRVSRRSADQRRGRAGTGRGRRLLPPVGRRRDPQPGRLRAAGDPGDLTCRASPSGPAALGRPRRRRAPAFLDRPPRRRHGARRAACCSRLRALDATGALTSQPARRHERAAAAAAPGPHGPRRPRGQGRREAARGSPSCSPNAAWVDAGADLSSRLDGFACDWSPAPATPPALAERWARRRPAR